MERLKELIVELRNDVKEKQLNISDDKLLELSTKLYISEIIQNQKSYKQQPIKEELATDKQKNYLNQLKIQFNPNITKKEAIKLLQQATS